LDGRAFARQARRTSQALSNSHRCRLAVMVIPAELLRNHFAYNNWADQRLLDAAAKLSPEELTRDFGTADKSVLGTLVHVFGAERLWLARFHGELNPPFISDADRSLAVLENDWPALAERWNLWLNTLTDEAASGFLSYKDMRGNPWKQRVGILVLHVVNHGTHHRGQAAGFLRALGHVPPPLDLSAYDREHPAGES
jgi:uncharacterized damage-inducible protein DinB